MSEQKTCCVKVYTVGYLHGAMPCGKTAKVERDSKWYCGTHDPVKVRERAAARSKAAQARGEAEREAHRAKLAAAAEQKRRADCFDELLEALEELLPGAETMGWATERAKAAIAKARGEAE